MPKSVSTVLDVFSEQLQDLYSAETQITKALPKMAKAATSPELKKGFELHLKQTQGHVERLEKICGKLGIKPSGKKCEATAGLVKEGKEAIDEKATPETKDLMLIGAARRVEHYEIAAYSGACDLAKALGETEALKALSQTLSEEVATDAKLAKAFVPAVAAASSSKD